VVRPLPLLTKKTEQDEIWVNGKKGRPKVFFAQQRKVHADKEKPISYLKKVVGLSGDIVKAFGIKGYAHPKAPA